jgi:hypothetical protein
MVENATMIPEGVFLEERKVRSLLRQCTLTERGWSCIQETEAILSHLEGQWATIIGAKRMEELKIDLRQLVTVANGGFLPQKFRPTW